MHMFDTIICLKLFCKVISIFSDNPCPPDQPFLCKSHAKCIPLEYVCNNFRDCPDGFDEQKAVCNASKYTDTIV